MTTLEDLMNAPAPASAWVLAQDCAQTGLDPQAVRAEMARRIGEMRASVERGLASDAKSITGMVGWNAKGLWDAPDVLDCADAPGRAAEALRAGCLRLVLDPDVPAFADLAGRAAGLGAAVLPVRPPALDLADPGARLRLDAWLAIG